MTKHLIQALPGHGVIAEPLLRFHPERDADCHPHPLVGLVQFGPFSRSSLGAVTDPIRVALIAPDGFIPKLRFLLTEFEKKHQPRERKQYLVEFPGFSRIFGLRLVTDTNIQLTLATSLSEELKTAKTPHILLAQHLTKAISLLETRRTEFDVVLLLIPQDWEEYGYGSDDDFDLHDYLKAICAAKSMPLQMVRESSALTYFCRCSVMWRLSVAFYCKAGGIPWRLADYDEDAAYVGLSYAIKQTSQGNHSFVTCCSQVFDADGVGLEFLAYDASVERIERDNPFLSRAEMRRVMARSLTLYQKRHGGKPPRRLVVHKTTEFKPDEVEGCFDALGSVSDVELIQVQDGVSWRGVALRHGGEKQPAQPEGYPVIRGSHVVVGGRDALLWTQGNAKHAVGGRDYFKEGKGIPAPLMLVRHAGSSPWIDECRAILGLSKMNWNNDGLYDRLPVTLGFAKELADVVKRIPQLDARPYQVRFFM